MKNITKINFSTGGFTLVEIMTSIIIISVLGILAVTYGDNYKLTQYNTKRISDISTLKNVFDTYYEDNKKYPLPTGNKKYYDKNGTYFHSQSGAYGVSSFVTENTFPKKYINFIPKDPSNGNYYAYGLMLEGEQKYELATNQNEKGEYFAYVKGNYPGIETKSLIKEYSGPNFVISGQKFLPYNPYELKLTGKISYYSGTVWINNDSNMITSKELIKGDAVKVSTGGLANIYLSDGSQIKLGNDKTISELYLEELSYKEDSNIITNVLMKLSLGELWVSAPELEKNSELETQTANIAATVRGTIYGALTNGNNSGSISLIEGKLEVNEIDNNTLLPIEDNSFTGESFIKENGKTYLEVLKGEDPVSLSYSNENISTGSVSEDKKEEILTPLSIINSSIVPKMNYLEKTSTGIFFETDLFDANQLDLIDLDSKYYKAIKINDICSISNMNCIINITNDSLYSAFQTTKNLGIRLCKKYYYSRSNIITNCSSYFQIKSDTSIFKIDSNNLSYTDEFQDKNEQITETNPILKTLESFSGKVITPDPINCIGPTEDQICELNLVAYAPYNRNFELYIGKNTYTLNSSEYLTDYLWNSQQMYQKYTKDISSFLNGDYNSLSNNRRAYSLEQAGLTNLGFNVSKIYNSSIYSWGNYATGIFIDNDNYESGYDYLLYDRIGSLGLNSGSGFTIEMSVRGGALKRNNGIYFLFYITYINGNATYFYQSSSQFMLNSTGYNKNLSSNCDGNNFCKVKFVVKNNLGEIYIDGIKQGNGISLSPNNIKDLYIGSSNQKMDQWNDIIDYVKIYKN